MYKAVFFDLYNTLARFHPPREETQVNAARQLGLDPDPAGIVRGYMAADRLMTEQNARFHIQKMTREARREFFAEYERLVLLGAGIDVSVEQAGRVWTLVRETPSQLAPFDDVLPTLALLKERQLTLGLISNIYRDLDELCQRMGIAPFLDVTVSSMTAGAEKPHPPIFLAALRKAGVAAEEAVHVGDQYQGDVVGARNVGIHPVLLDRDGVQDDHDDVDRIRGLGELPALVLG